MFNFKFPRRKNYKRIYLHDRSFVRDTNVIIRSLKTGKILDQGTNSILYAGSINAALKDYWYYTDKDKYLQLDNIAIPSSYDAAIYGNSEAGYSAEGVVCLFAVGVDGVEKTSQSSQKKAVQYEGWIDPKDMVPFRMVGRDTAAITSNQKKLYAQPYTSLTGPDPNEPMEFYYFKKFDQTPICVTQYENNGLQITSQANASIAQSKSGAKEYYDNYLISNQYNSGAQVITEMTCRVTEDECREWFEYGLTVESQQDPNVSSIMICTAIPELDEDGEIVAYHNIMPKSKRHITRELLLDEEKGLEITYQYIY